MTILLLFPHNRLRLMRPRWSWFCLRARAPSTIATAMVSVAGTRRQNQSGAIFASLGEICGLGAVCYRCLTGELPDDATERLRDDPLVPAVQHCKGKASTALLNAIDRSLKVDEGERPQSVAAWREMLLNKTVASAYHQIEETAKPATRPPSISSPEAKVGWLKLLWLVGVAVWVILLVFLVFYFTI